MRRTQWAVTVVGLLAVVALLGAGSVGALDDGTESLTYAAAENDSATPGEQFAGSVGVGHSEVEGEVDARAFEKRLGAAEDDDERAAVLADQLNRSEQRLNELQEQRAELRDARDAGEISEREYRIRITSLAADVAGVERMANSSVAAAEGIPDETLAANGVDVERIEDLRTNARDLRGGEVSEIARTIAGEGAGGAPNAPPGERGPPADRGPPSDRVGSSDIGSSGGSDAVNETEAGDGTGAGNESEASDGYGAGTGSEADDGSGDQDETEADDEDGEDTETAADEGDGGESANVADPSFGP